MAVQRGPAGDGAPRRRGGPRLPVLGSAISAALLLTVLILSALTASGASSAERPGPAGAAAHVVAYVNGAPIWSDRLDLAVNALIPQQSFHRNVKPEKVAELRQTALDTIVNEELQYQDAVRRGLWASAGEVNAGLAEVAARYPSPEAFAAACRRNHVTDEAIRRDIQRVVMIRKAADVVVTSQCRVAREEAARYFGASPERFVVPEEVHIQAITIGVDPSSPPAAWAAAKARAEHVRLRLLGGAPFDAMARQYSTDPNREKGGDMGYYHRGSLADEFEKAAARLRPGQVSAVVSTIYGYHLIRIMDVRPSRQKTFDEVAAELQKDLTNQRCAELSEAWVGRLRADASIAVVDESRPASARGPLPGGGAR